MKNIQAQYQDLLEGKMSPANFMVNVRREFPQWVSPVNTFKDAVNILKNKRILSEDWNKNWGDRPSAEGLIKKLLAKGYSYKEAIELAAANLEVDAEELAVKYPRDVVDIEGHGDLEEDLGAAQDEFDASQQDTDNGSSDAETIAEAAMWNPNTEAPQEVGYDQVNYRQLMKGMEFELSKAPEITDEALVKAKQKALKNLKKDPNFYRNLLIANVEDVDKMDKTLKQTPVKKDNTVDKANAMKVIKKDVKGNVQDSLGKKEKAKKKDGEGIKQMTQTPKKVKGVEAFDTPGKEKVMALKEHIMNEFSGHNKFFSTPQFSVGSRVESRDGKIVGEIVEFDNHTATVKEDGTGKIVHVQPNVLQHSAGAPKTQAPADQSKSVPSESMDKSKKLADLKEKLMKAIEEDLEEGAVAQTASGVTVASGKNPGDVAKRAMDLKQQTGDSFTVLDTKAGTRRKI